MPKIEDPNVMQAIIEQGNMLYGTLVKDIDRKLAEKLGGKLGEKFIEQLVETRADKIAPVQTDHAPTGVAAPLADAELLGTSRQLHHVLLQKKKSCERRIRNLKSRNAPSQEAEQELADLNRQLTEVITVKAENRGCTMNELGELEQRARKRLNTALRDKNDEEAKLARGELVRLSKQRHNLGRNIRF